MTHRNPCCAIVLICVACSASAAEPPAPSPEAQEAARAAALEAADIAYAGTWHATEVIVFERSHVDAASYGEGLLIDRARTFPARLRGLDPAGTGSSVYYSADPDDPRCRRGGQGAVPDASAIPEAFVRQAASAPAPAEEASPGAAPAADAKEAPSADPTATTQPGPPPDPYEELRKAVRSYEEKLSEQSLVWLPPESRSLNQQAGRLASSGYRVLLHEAWVQDLAQRDIPDAILIQVGSADAGPAELEGLLRFGSERGTRFEAELWYQPPGGTAAPAEYVELREARRLGNGELHYLDHPKLGVLVRTAPVPLPADVVEAFEALSPPAAESNGAAVPSGPLPLQ